MQYIRVKLPIENVNYLLEAIALLDIDDYMVFEDDTSETSSHMGSDDLPMASMMILEMRENEQAKELLKSLNFAFELIEFKPELNNLVEDIEVGSFLITNDPEKRNTPNKHVIYLESAMAFGTGQHQTTQGCLSALEKNKDRKFNTILDLGCGSGILAIGAAKMFKPRTLIACDIEESSVEVAKHNLAVNHVDCGLFLSDGFNGLPKNQTYDLIIANILLKPLCAMTDEIISSLNKRGVLILSGIISSQKQDLLNAYGALKVTDVINNEDWLAITFVNDCG